MDKEIKEIFSRRIAPGSPAGFPWKENKIIIYGAGNCGRDALAALRGIGVTVQRFLDANVAPGTSIDGVTVFRPDDKTISAEERAESCVVLGIFNAYVDMPPIITALKTYGYGKIVSFLEFHRYFHKELGDRFWLTSTDFYEENKPRLSEAYSLWEDEISRELYKTILNFRFTGDYNVLPPPELGKQYFDPAIPRRKGPVSFIDCGSYDGDTLEGLRREYGTAKMVAAFEPDPENFAKVSEFVRTANPPVAEKAVLFPCGVWSRQEQFAFSSGGNAGSHLSESGEIKIQCVSLDESLHGFHPTLIKMDIEGAEYEALTGAKRIIHEDRPDLAICLYHRPEDLWRIPLLVKGWALGYKFHLRMYCYSGFELVMYAVRD